MDNNAWDIVSGSKATARKDYVCALDWSPVIDTTSGRLGNAKQK
jgi:hypothetical protein